MYFPKLILKEEVKWSAEPSVNLIVLSFMGTDFSSFKSSLGGDKSNSKNRCASCPMMETENCVRARVGKGSQAVAVAARAEGRLGTA